MPSSTPEASPSPIVEKPAPALALDLAEIGPRTAAGIQRLGHIDITGRLVFSSDSRSFALISEHGIYVYSADPLEQIVFLEGGLGFEFSPDGQSLAWSAADGAVTVWDINSRAPQIEMIGLSDSCCRQVSFSPDGRYLITKEPTFPPAGTVNLWDLSTRQVVGTWEAVWDFGFSPNGKILSLQSGAEIAVTLWDVEGRKGLRTLSGFTTAAPFYVTLFSPDWRWLAWFVRAGGDLMDVSSGEIVFFFDGDVISFSPDGRILATSETGWTDSPCTAAVCLYYAASGERLRTLPHENIVWLPPAFSPDGRLLRTLDAERVRLWEVASGRELAVLGAHLIQATHVRLSPDWGILAIADDNTVRLWDVASEQQLALLGEHASTVSHLTFSPDGLILATADETVVKLWNVRTATELASFAAGSGNIQNARFSPHARILTLEVFEPETEEQSLELWGVPTRIAFPSDIKVIAVQNAVSLRTVAQLNLDGPTDVTLSPNADLLAVALQDGRIELWDTTGKSAVRELDGHSSWVYELAFSPNGSNLASASMDGSVRLWNLDGAEELQILTGHAGEVSSVAFAPDGDSLATASQDGTVKIWDAATGTEVAMLSDHTSWVWSVAFSRHGRSLATASADRTVKLWDLESGEVLFSLLGHTSTVRRAVFSHDDSMVASASWDGTIKLWDVANGEELRTLRGHTDWVYGVAFSPDARVLASSSRDGEVKLWDVASGSEVASLVGHTDIVWNVAFSPDGRFLVSAAQDGWIRLWAVSP